MHFSPELDDHGLPFHPFKACVGPRPIGWISTVSRDGIDNLAPFSQFQNLSYDPPLVMISINQGGTEDHPRRKDTVNNIEATGCFVYNMVPYALREQMNITAAGAAPDEDEFQLAGLTKADSIRVKAKRVAESPVQFECEYVQTLRFPGKSAKGTADVIIGRVVEIHIADDVIRPDGKLDVEKIQPLGRLGYFDYTVADSVFSMIVPGVSTKALEAMEGKPADKP
jgi:flavin reductase (DIM6/NTAB) family NADH-FMN oxidoreductase RutF